MEWQVRRLGSRFELYDLESDPDEIANLAGLEQYQEMVKTFCGKPKTFQEETNDPWLHKWEYE
jgi:N-sulfoglucosamine sulfohydrolase